MLCSLPVIYLGPNYGGGNEDTGDLLQEVPRMHHCPQCPQTCSSHCQTTPPPETPGHSQASLGQSLVGSLLLFPGSWCSQESISQSCVNNDSFMVGLMATSSKRAYAIPRSAAPRAPDPAAGHCWPHLHRRCSNTVHQSLWVILMTQFLKLMCSWSLLFMDSVSKFSYLLKLICNPRSILRCFYGRSQT